MAAALLGAPALAQPLPPPASAGPGWDLHDLEALTQHARRLQQQTEGATEAAAIAADAAARRSAGQVDAGSVLPPSPFGVPARAEAPAERDPARRPLLLFVSASMGEASLGDALREASDDGAATIVWRGLGQGEQLRDAALRLAGLAQGIEPPAAQGIDPPLFRRHGITAVPAIVDPLTGSELRGSTSIARMRAILRERAVRGETGIFSELIGPTAPVVEPDLAKVLRARAGALDPSAEIRRSAERWWSRQSFVELPPAPRDRIRVVDPTLYLQTDLRGPGGAVVAPAGTRVNPLERMPMRSVLLVFDARDPRQVAWAAAAAGTVRPYILIATAFDREGGWEGHAELTRSLGRRVHLLPSGLAERLGLEFVPARVEAYGTRLRVTETAHVRLPLPPHEVGHVAPR